MVRAAINGISAIISPAGKLLAKRDHYKEGPGMICAEVPIRQNKTTFSQLGHSPVILSFIYLAFYIGRKRTFKASRPFCDKLGKMAGDTSVTKQDLLRHTV